MIKPTSNNILVKKDELEEKSQGGIFLPETLDRKPTTAKVVAVGPGKLSPLGVTLPVEVKVGDEVAITKFSGSEVKVNGEIFHLMPETEVLCIIERITSEN